MIARFWLITLGVALNLWCHAGGNMMDCSNEEVILLQLTLEGTKADTRADKTRSSRFGVDRYSKKSNSNNSLPSNRSLDAAAGGADVTVELRTPEVTRKLPYLKSTICVVVVTLFYICIYFRYSFYHSWYNKASADIGISNPFEGLAETCVTWLHDRFGLETTMINTDYAPDFVLVFHHPLHSYDDSDDIVERDVEQNLINEKGLERKAKWFRRLLTVLGGDECTKEKARLAFLQDFVEGTDRQGFDVQVLTDIDDDEIFVCLNLTDETLINTLITFQNVHLRLNAEIRRKFNIKQDGPLSTMPLHPYTEVVLPHLVEERILTEANPRELFETFNGSLVSGGMRVQLIEKFLGDLMSLPDAEDIGLVLDHFPGHYPDTLLSFRMSWANWSKVLDWSFAQPLTEITDYFGPLIGFVTAWTGLQCKALLALVPPALLCMILNACGYVSISMVAFMTILVIWSGLMESAWSEERDLCKVEWNIKDEGQDEAIRPQYVGSTVPSKVDGNQTTREYHPTLAMIRVCCSWTVTIVTCMAIMTGVYLWVDVFGLKPGFFLGLCFSAQIQVGRFIFGHLALSLTLFENRKHHSDLYSSYLWKVFVFNCLNFYFPFFYLTVLAPLTQAGCPNNDCYGSAQAQLTITLVILTAMRIVEVLLAGVKVQVSLWCDQRRLRRKAEANLKSSHEGSEDGGWSSIRRARRKSSSEGSEPHLPPKLTSAIELMRADRGASFVEMQVKFDEYEMKEQVKDMNLSMLALGFVFLYGILLPGSVLLCFAQFVFQLRGRALRLCSSSQRTKRKSGAAFVYWETVLSVLQFFGVLNTGFIFVTHPNLLLQASSAEKLTYFIGWCLFSIVMRSIFSDLDISGNGYDAEVLQARQNYVLRELNRCLQSRIWHGRHESDFESEGAPTSDVKLTLASNWKQLKHANTTRLAQ